MNKIELNFQKRDKALKANAIRNIINIIFKTLKLDDVEISVLLCNNEYIQNLNRDFRNKDKSTDVLSFPSGDIKGDFLGDIAISIEKAKEQAPSFNNDFESEIKRLLIHGILHLLGYDHELGQKEEEEMKNKENDLFKEVKDLKLC